VRDQETERDRTGEERTRGRSSDLGPTFGEAETVQQFLWSGVVAEGGWRCDFWWNPGQFSTRHCWFSGGSSARTNFRRLEAVLRRVFGKRGSESFRGAFSSSFPVGSTEGQIPVSLVILGRN